MPFTSAMLLGVAGGAGFDAIVTFPSGYSVPGSGGSNRYKSDSSGAPAIISDPNGIIVNTFSRTTYDSIQLENLETYEITVIAQPTYSSSSTEDKAGLSFIRIDTAGDPDAGSPPNFITNATFSSGNPVNLDAVSVTPSVGGNAGLGFVLFRKNSGETFSTSGVLKLGITKTS